MARLFILLFFSLWTVNVIAQSQFIEFSDNWNKAYIYQANNKFDSAVFYYDKAHVLHHPEFGASFYTEMAGFYSQNGKPDKWYHSMVEAIENGLSKEQFDYMHEKNVVHQLNDGYIKLLDIFPQLHRKSIGSVDIEMISSLNRIFAIDQFFRWDTLCRSVGCTYRKISSVDSVNIAAVEKILLNGIFPNRVLIGNSNQSLFQVLLMHLTIYDSFKEKWQEKIYQQTKLGNFSNVFYALMVDRNRVWRKQGHQIYGWYDFDYDYKKYGNFDNIKTVDSLRQEIGLPCIYEEYLSGKIDKLPDGYEPSAFQVQYYKWLGK